MNQIFADFARGDFSAVAHCFEQAGLVVDSPLEGVLQCSSPQPQTPRRRLLISVGVHGDETAPLELLALLMDELSQQPSALRCDLMLMVGNLAAIQAGKRFIDVDLNRLFTPERAQFNETREGKRADQLMALSRQFFAGHTNGWHLDLHTAIRDSVYPSFAIIPGQPDGSFLKWLGSAGLQALVFNPDGALTFSAFSSRYLGAASCTAELGRIGTLGQNDLSQFSKTRTALAGLLRGVEDVASDGPEPLRFRVAQELIKHSDAFRLSFDAATKNFTAFLPRTVIAQDGAIIYDTGATEEYVLFPNPSVRVGLRAGLMVVREN